MNNEQDLDSLFIICPTCAARFKRRKEQEEKHPLYFCAYCGTRLRHNTHAETIEKEDLSYDATIVSSHLPQKHETQTLGHYQILERIGKGGMGEVFVAYDTICGRKIALKRIRPDLIDFPHIQKRFLHEARITSQLMHPAIIPIYAIDCEEGYIYYSMPYVEGKTLKQILKEARVDTAQESRQNRVKETTSIPYLIRPFLQVCQAIAYAHSHNVLHRDIKPENIIVGNYGQIHILDWGLAKVIGEKEVPIKAAKQKGHRYETRLGKVVGTISYMAPERALGNSATVQTDIYSLGVILYQILTLYYPFRRKSLNWLKKNWMKEKWVEPEVMAPYREVPEVLSKIAKKCLMPNPDHRYKSVDELIASLENYLEGKAEWFQAAVLDVHKKEDWLFQENVLLAEHTAITQAPESLDWVNLMISKVEFQENIKIELNVSLGRQSHGIGIMFNVPENNEGYCLWLASVYETQRTTKLLHATVSVFEYPEFSLKTECVYRIRIEKRDDRIAFYVNNNFQWSYASHIPQMGNRVGVILRDADLEINDFSVSVTGQNIHVSCLAVADAFLTRKMYKEALFEYRKIGQTFLGHQEGREALFRAGITLLEEAKNVHFHKEQIKLFDKTLLEFSKLRKTPGAPLEYLGKAYVYKEMKEYEEEVKCFELALRRYANHPLLPIIYEQIVFRMHESSRQNRISAYYFICLALRFIPESSDSPTSAKLFESLQKHSERPFFVLHEQNSDDAALNRLSLCLGVSFWLAKPYILAETFEEILARPKIALQHLADTIFLLVLLGAKNIAEEKMARIMQILSEGEKKRYAKTLTPLEILLKTSDHMQEGLNWIQTLENLVDIEQERLVWYMLRTALNIRNVEAVSLIVQKLLEGSCSFEKQEIMDALMLEALLYQNDLKNIEKVLNKYEIKALTTESSPLYFVYGCYKAKIEGVQSALIMFSKLLDIAFPRSWVIASHFLAGKIHMTSAGWFSQSFLFERRSLYEQLALFWHCGQSPEKEMSWFKLIKDEFIFY